MFANATVSLCLSPISVYDITVAIFSTAKGERRVRGEEDNNNKNDYIQYTYNKVYGYNPQNNIHVYVHKHEHYDQKQTSVSGMHKMTRILHKTFPSSLPFHSIRYCNSVLPSHLFTSSSSIQYIQHNNGTINHAGLSTYT